MYCLDFTRKPMGTVEFLAESDAQYICYKMFDQRFQWGGLTPAYPDNLIERFVEGIL